MSEEVPVHVNLEERIQNTRENRPPRRFNGGNRGGGRERYVL